MRIKFIYLQLAICVAVFCFPFTAHAQTPFTTVVVDAGHGGFDRGGGPGQRVPEKDKTLDVALRLRNVLQSAGYRVVMTRSNDTFIPLGTRTAIANSNRNAIFVSIHFNSAPRSGANGIETYFYSAESAPLAGAIHANVVRTAGSENRGVRRRGFFVLRRTSIPAVLCECGFLTNPRESSNAQSGAYRQQLAEAIARGIQSRSTIGPRTASSSQASRVDVGAQPFLDQRYNHESFSRHSKSKGRKSSSSSRKKSSSKKKHSSDSDSTRKKKKPDTTEN